MLLEYQRNNQPQFLKLNQKLFPLQPHLLLPSRFPNLPQPSFANSKARVFYTLQILVDSQIPLLLTLINTKFLLTSNNNNLKQFLLPSLLSSLDTLLPLSTLRVLLLSTLMEGTVLPILLLPLLNSTPLTTLLHLHAALLLPLFHHLWISQGTGNANFFYASTLVFGMANGAALVDCMWAGLRIAVGEAGEGWEVVQE